MKREDATAVAIVLVVAFAIPLAAALATLAYNAGVWPFTKGL